ncbi:MAG: LuxR C-terminal-related transcriptional regulator [Pseudomonadota bacterium]
MVRTILLYAIALGACAIGLQWLDAQLLGRRVSSEAHIVIIAAGFAVLGGWVAIKLQAPHPVKDFEANEAAIKSLGLTARERDVLENLANGQSYKEIARTLDMSPNTVKTHVSNLYRKLESDRRAHAIQKARTLSIIP